ncbi:MAG: cytochrome c oxidase assembly protein [Alphaproteobacteria bacterium]|nr:cytochrome c oxidase assembly protein [Alphaproteobacteria bacterium]
MNAAANPRRRHAITVAGLAMVIMAMGGLVYASVPLYQWFCQATGYGGTTNTAVEAPAVIGEREMIVRFNADVNSRLPWEFEPSQREVVVRLGEQTLAFYQARNTGEEAIVGTATFNVTPQKAGYYFTKIECFCFTEQRLAPGESLEMPVSFFIDPDLAADPNLDDVTSITLSYTFFRDLEDKPDATAEQAAWTTAEERLAAAQ